MKIMKGNKMLDYMKGVLKNMPNISPKVTRMMQIIYECDKKDMAKHGKLFKHFIYSDVIEGGCGAKFLASAFIALGFRIIFNSRFNIIIPPPNNKQNNFAVLSSTALYNQPFSNKLKK